MSGGPPVKNCDCPGAVACRRRGILNPWLIVPAGLVELRPHDQARRNGQLSDCRADRRFGRQSCPRFTVGREPVEPEASLSAPEREAVRAEPASAAGLPRAGPEEPAEPVARWARTGRWQVGLLGSGWGLAWPALDRDTLRRETLRRCHSSYRRRRLQCRHKRRTCRRRTSRYRNRTTNPCRSSPTAGHHGGVRTSRRCNHCSNRRRDRSRCRRLCSSCSNRRPGG